MNTLKTEITELVGITHPIMQDGMGPFRTSKLAAAVSEAGGLGTVSIPGMTIPGDEAKRVIREHIEETLSLTDKPFAANVPVGLDDEGKILEISDALISAVIEARAEDERARNQLKVLVTSAGHPGDFVDRIQESGLIHFCKVGSTRQALKAEEAGVNVIIASGYEMGGHTHARPVHTFVLAANICEKVKLPVIVSGGVRDGRGLAAALSFGAAGVAMGTRFIATEENVDWHPNYRQMIVDAREGQDGIVPGVYAPARVLKNAGSEEVIELTKKKELSVDEMSVRKDDMLRQAQIDGDVEKGLVAAGQVASGIEEIVSIAEFVPQMADEAANVLRSRSEMIVPAPVAG